MIVKIENVDIVINLHKVNILFYLMIFVKKIVHKIMLYKHLFLMEFL